MALPLVEQVLAEIPAESRCLNPRCPKPCAWRSHGRGRQPRYCSGACRAAYSRDRSRWTRHLGELQLQLRSAAAAADIDDLERSISAVRWVLARYVADNADTT